MNAFTQRPGEQASHKLPREAKGEQEAEQDQRQEAEEQVQKQKVGQVRRKDSGEGSASVHRSGAPWHVAVDARRGPGCRLSPESLKELLQLLSQGFTVLHG